jgi:hypothetical protein
MRDVLAVAGVIVVALGLGGTAAYMSVDFTPPGLDLIRPQKPAVVAQIKKVEHERAVQAEASSCKYCSDIAELAQTFSRRAETARTHAAALKAALPQVSDETSLRAGRIEELKQAQIAAQRADQAASVLTGWASRCTAQDFCKAPIQATQAACATEADPRADATNLIALAVRKAAQACATAACPSVDCQSSASLRADLTQIERSLDGVGGLSSVAMDQVAMASLPVGPSTLKAELKRISDEAGYVARMMPLLLDTKKKDSQLPKLAPVMIDERAVSASTLATVMEQAAQVSDGGKTTDPRYEAAWRLKSLAANMAALGKDARAGRTIDWEAAADSMGAAFMDLARLDAMLDRVGKAKPVGAGCDTTAASAAQQLREASAMLDLCRMRSACVGRGGATSRVHAAADAPSNVFERAQAAADALTVGDLGENEVIAVADASVRPAIEVLRSRGVCRRAGDLREAKAAAPEISVAVAEEAVTPALSPTTGVVSPQDLVAGAMQAAIDTPAAPEAETITTAVVEEVARYSSAAPRFKPRRMQAGDADVVRVAAPPRAAAPDLTPAYQGVVLPEAGAPGAAFGGGAGGPTRTTPPVESPTPPPEQE